MSASQEVSHFCLLILRSKNNYNQLKVCIARLRLIPDAQTTLTETLPSTIIHGTDFPLKPGVHLWKKISLHFVL